MKNIGLSLCVYVCVSTIAISLSAGGDWPQWRGPTGDGVSHETEVPVDWSETSGVQWKCRLPEWGDSVPAIWGDAIFLTSHVDDQRLVLLRIDKQTGQIQWTRQVSGGPDKPATAPRTTAEKRGSQKFHRDHNLASPSPVTDGNTVVVHFGNGDLAAYDFDGQQLWFRNLQKDYGKYTIWWGHANSPVIHDNLVISVCMQDSCHGIQSSPAPSYLVAHDLRTGRQRWKTSRMTGATSENCDSYTTPIFRQANGRLEMIVMGGEVLDAYDPASGDLLWALDAVTGNRVIPTPVVAQGMIYAVRGMRGPLVAVSPGGDGQRGEEDIAWQFDQSTSDSPSPVVAGDLLLMISNNGIAQCFDATKGSLLWKERLKGDYRASPIVAGGRVYFQNRDGLTTVVSASRRFERLAENELNDETIASLAISDKRVFVRGRKWLYCIGDARGD